MNRKQASLTLRVTTLQAELATCATDAMRACVRESLLDAMRQLREAGR